MIDYRVELDDPHAHQYRVTLTVAQPGSEVVLALPVWIPGSYLVREFARHLSGLGARQGRRVLVVEALDKSRWRVRCSGRAPLVLRYRVYAFDTSVRACFLDSRRGFFNGTGLCLRVEGREAEPHRLALGRLPPGWEVATAMPTDGKGAWVAADYDELVDHPFELGSFWRGRFDVGGVAHEFVVTGARPRFDGERLLADTRRICAAQQAFWHGHDGSRPPFARYVFMLNALDEGYGGLEHRASTALACARRDLPTQAAGAGAAAGGSGPAAESDGYTALLAVVSHEYFHTWNVKRLKPAALARIDYQRENPTELLWFFEGFTAYYDELLLCRCGLVDPARYLKLLAKTVNALAAAPGRRVQSVAAAGADAWTKFYRPDENTPNATVSYYQKGALVALALDLTLRTASRASRGGGTLDDVMRLLWRRGTDAGGGGPVDEAQIADALAEVAGRRLDAELAAWVHGTTELPLDDLLAAAGVEVGHERAGWAASLGLKLTESPTTGVQVKSVLAGSAALRAGLSAGDELLAVDGWRIRKLDDAQAWTGRDQPFQLLLVRDQRVMTLRVVPEADSALARSVTLTPAARPARGALARRRAWLGG